MPDLTDDELAELMTDDAALKAFMADVLPPQMPECQRRTLPKEGCPAECSGKRLDRRVTGSTCNILQAVGEEQLTNMKVDLVSRTARQTGYRLSAARHRRLHGGGPARQPQRRRATHRCNQLMKSAVALLWSNKVNVLLNSRDKDGEAAFSARCPEFKHRFCPGQRTPPVRRARWRSSAICADGLGADAACDKCEALAQIDPVLTCPAGRSELVNPGL